MYGSAGGGSGDFSTALNWAFAAPRTDTEPSSSEPVRPPATGVIVAVSPFASVAVTSMKSPGTTNRLPIEIDCRLAGALPGQVTAGPSSAQRSGFAGASDWIDSGSTKCSVKSYEPV